jgi:hypothetical protein
VVYAVDDNPNCFIVGGGSDPAFGPSKLTYTP